MRAKQTVARNFFKAFQPLNIAIVITVAIIVISCMTLSIPPSQCACPTWNDLEVFDKEI